MVSSITPFLAPTEVDHYQIRRRIDVLVRPVGEDLGKLSASIDRIVANTKLPAGVAVTIRGTVEAMFTSFRSFAIGLTLSVVLLYLILVAQFRSFIDPFIILLALPPGISGVLIVLTATGTTLNVMSLMGIVMLAGIAMSNSILIVEFAHHLLEEGLGVREAVITACRVRLRPVLMTSLATIIGLLPMALKLGEGSESYAPGAGPDRRSDSLGYFDGVPGASRLLPRLRQTKPETSSGIIPPSHRGLPTAYIISRLARVE